MRDCSSTPNTRTYNNNTDRNTAHSQDCSGGNAVYPNPQAVK